MQAATPRRALLSVCNKANFPNTKTLFLNGNTPKKLVNTDTRHLHTLLLPWTELLPN